MTWKLFFGIACAVFALYRLVTLSGHAIRGKAGGSSGVIIGVVVVALAIWGAAWAFEVLP